MKNNKKRIIGILVISLLISIATFSYALWQKYFTQSGENTTTTANCFNVTYTGGDNVTLTGVVPQTDEEGMQNTKPYEVTITNSCPNTVVYNVVLNKKSTSTLADTHVKVTTGAVPKLLSNTETTPTNTSSVGSGYTNGTSNIISKSFVGPNETKKVKVKTWMDNATNQTDGQNKTFNYKVSIETTATSQTPELESVNILGKNYPVIAATPDFTKGFPNSSTTADDKKNLSGLYQSYDDDGDTYYFRGAVENNYVEFAGQTWRILRINGDGTIRLILNENLSEEKAFNTTSSGHKYVGYTYDNKSSCTNANPCKNTYNSSSNSFTMSSDATNSTMKSYLEEWYGTNLGTNDSKIATTTFCNDVSYGSGTEDSSSYVYYGPYERIFGTQKGHPSLECPDPYKNGNSTLRDYGGVYKLKIGLITSDELNMGGYRVGGTSYGNDDHYLKRSTDYWTLSPHYAYTSGAYVVYAYSGGYINSISVGVRNGVAPVINLKTGTLSTSGDGTESSKLTVQ